MAKAIDRDRDWDFHLRSLSANARDSSSASDPASDPSLLQSVKKLYEMCKAESSEDLVARVYPHINKLFHRSVASLPHSSGSNGLLLLAIIQFFLDFGEVVLHDADPSLRTFFRSCLSREFADPVVAEATLNFLNLNKTKLQSSFPTLLPQFFPLLLKLIAWNGEKYIKEAPGRDVFYVRHGHLTVTGYSDADWAGSSDESTTGYCTFAGGNLVSWKSKKQFVVSRSNAEAEYRAMTLTVCELIWLREFMEEIGLDMS